MGFTERCRLKVGAFLALSSFLLLGCSDKHPASRVDVAGYVSYKCGISDFTVSNNPQEIADTDSENSTGKNDYLWTVTEADGTQFLVLDDYHKTYGPFGGMKYGLTDNFNSVHLKRCLEHAELGSLIVQGDEKEFFTGIWLQGSFRTRHELHRLVDQLNALSQGCPQGLVLPYCLRYDHPYRERRPECSDSGDITAILSGLKAGEKLSYDKCDERMLKAAIPMRYEQTLKEFTPEEIHAYIKGNDWSFGVMQADGSYKIYDDLLLQDMCNSLTLPTAYEVLKRNGYKVTGSPSRFSFEGVDGHTYEFGLDFYSDDSYYCLKDGKREPMEFRAGNFFTLDRFRELTGIECAFYSRIVKAEEK